MYKGFPKELVNILKCPKCAGRLSAFSEGSHILEGEALCQKCASRYQIREGILSLLEGQGIKDELLLSEIKARDADAFRYDGKFSQRFYKEVLPTKKALGETKGKNIIEYGSGTGRFTEIFSKEADFYLATDFSLVSLKITAKKIESVKVGLVLADSITLKTEESFFDAALSLQLIEHIPTIKQREVFFENIKSTLKSGAPFISSTYHQDLRRILKKEVKTGKHAGGIFFYNFSVAELRAEIGKYFKIIKAHPIDIALPFEIRLGFSPKVGGLIEALAERSPILNKFGHLVLVKAVK
ncbi:MAG TPA: methyltransferase domain-containing protein [Candidatus Paceibacterota bacterium]